ncbi:hypothetical protein [Exiguobacterium undae]|uniref:DUF3137 domain-containing protein n=1 Tax=Exiguobacterium undae TaxID=169177 RepID=A0ABX2V547_9BACL|nr:hypothetical protein [Exiguobacterium undae]OAN10152.1 hypothetical protein A3783_15425 [Exiguobacterium undae]
MNKKTEVSYLEVNKNFNTPSNVTIIVFGIIIILSTASLLYVFPDKFEIIFGIGTVLFVSLGIFVNLKSLATAQSAREDSKSSAASAKDSVRVAENALEIAKSEADANAMRYRIEKGSFLALKKKEFLVPLFAPHSYKARFHTTESLDALHNPGAMLLENKGMGTATNVSYSFHLLNADDYRNLKFESDNVADDSAINESFYHSYHRGFPKYTLYSKLYTDRKNERTGLLLTCTEDQGNFSEQTSPRNKKAFQRYIESPEAIQIGYLDNKEGKWIHLPLSFRVLSHQYFLEQRILKEEFQKTASPQLLLRVYYTEEISEHMNQFEESRRVKEFLITSSNNIKVVPEPADTTHDRTGKMLLCQYVIKALGNEPLSSYESEQTEVLTDGSTGPTEG